MSTFKNLSIAALAVAFAGHIAWWMADGRDKLEGIVAQTLDTDLAHKIAKARADGSCLPRHVLLETKTPDADTLSPETLALLTDVCEGRSVVFHAEPPTEDLGCAPDRCDCVGYAQQIRFNTPFVAAAYTHYFRGDVYQTSESYFYTWWFGRWYQLKAPKYEGE